MVGTVLCIQSSFWHEEFAQGCYHGLWFQWDWLQVLHKVGAERAAAAVLTLDTPGANYRTVWALTKNFPHVKTFVRAHDVDHGINLEKAGATAVGCLNF
jgi:hypothetical protein